ncbi:MAG: hypothetical protein ABJA32_07850, partial [Ginsengibacter sp.]
KGIFFYGLSFLMAYNALIYAVTRYSSKKIVFNFHHFLFINFVLSLVHSDRYNRCHLCEKMTPLAAKKRPPQLRSSLKVHRSC